MNNRQLLPHLFRTEYQKITAVLTKLFGFEHVETAEDIASETFLQASETWAFKGLPENPVAWLYTVAKNKAKNQLKHNAVFSLKVAPQLAKTHVADETVIDLSEENIADSQLQMIFAVCHPAISPEAQTGLALRILCGFGISEIAAAFLTNKETINKRLLRAKEKLREAKVKIELPPASELNNRLETVLITLYLLFNEGYYSSVNTETTLRKELCLEAMRLVYLLAENTQTATPSVHALLALMCFHASRFDARVNPEGQTILYEDQDTALWNTELIRKGEYYLNLASRGSSLTKYHVEAGIGYWHTVKEDSPEKWEHILQYYNQLLLIEYSPIAALNRTYALSKANGKTAAIKEAEKLQLNSNHLYHSLLGELYRGVNDAVAVKHFEQAYQLASAAADKKIIAAKIKLLEI